jgi:hypothetical protein
MKKICVLILSLILISFAMVEVVSIMSLVSSYYEEIEIQLIKNEYNILHNRYRKMSFENYCIVNDICNKYAAIGADKFVIMAQIQEESGWEQYATSRCGARGLMQLMPGTAKWMGVSDITNKRQNIEGGIKYLYLHCMPASHYRIHEAIRRYNCGAGWRYKTFPMETDIYATRCMRHIEKTKLLCHNGYGELYKLAIL